eukprot:TRINITY_DN22204_c0_g1_i1.p1 TRINITY_DN22204_c0_g1~~TRINITY_DN22204_c0_g1_i1.p1  ORF type:complete len:548 (-),score=126.21 TRINITY_DN22204_c0_g1_i1:121-1764(-)
MAECVKLRRSVSLDSGRCAHQPLKRRLANAHEDDPRIQSCRRLFTSDGNENISTNTMERERSLSGSDYRTSDDMFSKKIPQKCFGDDVLKSTTPERDSFKLFHNTIPLPEPTQTTAPKRETFKFGYSVPLEPTRVTSERDAFNFLKQRVNSVRMKANQFQRNSAKVTRGSNIFEIQKNPIHPETGNSVHVRMKNDTNITDPLNPSLASTTSNTNSSNDSLSNPSAPPLLKPPIDPLSNTHSNSLTNLSSNPPTRSITHPSNDSLSNPRTTPKTDPLTLPHPTDSSTQTPVSQSITKQAGANPTLEREEKKKKKKKKETNSKDEKTTTLGHSLEKQHPIIHSTQPGNKREKINTWWNQITTEKSWENQINPVDERGREKKETEENFGSEPTIKITGNKLATDDKGKHNHLHQDQNLANRYQNTKMDGEESEQLEKKYRELMKRKVELEIQIYEKKNELGLYKRLIQKNSFHRVDHASEGIPRSVNCCLILKRYQQNEEQVKLCQNFVGLWQKRRRMILFDSQRSLFFNNFPSTCLGKVIEAIKTWIVC